MIEELHDPWVKRLLVGFARTSDCNGPRKPDGSHHLIQEIDSEQPVCKPALQLTHSIFGSSPPMRNFDPAKLLTVSILLPSLLFFEEYPLHLLTFGSNGCSYLNNFDIGLWEASNT
jgi:DNA helicase INO80